MRPNTEGRSMSRHDPSATWLALLKSTIARFSRGNIAAQNARILTQEEQERERVQAVEIAKQWRDRAQHSTSN